MKQRRKYVIVELNSWDVALILFASIIPLAMILMFLAALIDVIIGLIR